MKNYKDWNWKKKFAINIAYYAGLVFFIKIPDFIQSTKVKWKKVSDKINEDLGEKRF